MGYKVTRPCRVCGRLFVPCQDCGGSAFRWRAFACSPECAKRYFAAVEDARRGQDAGLAPGSGIRGAGKPPAGGSEYGGSGNAGAARDVSRKGRSGTRARNGARRAAGGAGKSAETERIG